MAELHRGTSLTPSWSVPFISKMKLGEMRKRTKEQCFTQMWHEAFPALVAARNGKVQGRRTCPQATLLIAFSRWCRFGKDKRHVRFHIPFKWCNKIKRKEIGQKAGHDWVKAHYNWIQKFFQTAKTICGNAKLAENFWNGALLYEGQSYGTAGENL